MIFLLSLEAITGTYVYAKEHEHSWRHLAHGHG